MIGVGVIGLGMMGATHLDVYAQRGDVRVVALSDRSPDRLAGRTRASGNIQGQAQGGCEFPSARRYREAEQLIADPDVELVDICLPTPLHRQFVEAALARGKHVLVEKPVARTAEDAFAMAGAAEQATTFAMPAMCMRFWPGWDWLKRSIDAQSFGRVLSASFRRLAAHPGGGFYESGEASGGAILDLHIHDADFVHHCFGLPEAVFSRGYSRITSEPDHVVTQYLFGRDGPLVIAEGGWSMAPGFGFQMQYTVNFEDATAVYDLAKAQPLTLVRGGLQEPVELPEGLGYAYEIDYLLRCVAAQRRPERVTMRQAALSVALVEAEKRSLTTGQVTPVEH